MQQKRVFRYNASTITNNHMQELKKAAEQLRQLAEKVTTFQTVSRSLRDGNNGFFTKKMKQFKQRLLADLKRESK